MLMKTVKLSVNGKINLGLNVLGVEENFHTLRSVFAEINFADTISLRTRKDKLISLEVKGVDMSKIAVCDNNVYKTAISFMNEFGTNGADIKLTKRIPAGSGLGGSSVDIVATAKAMAKAYGVDDDLTGFVSKFCSDGEFLLHGGCSLVEGRGHIVRKIRLMRPLYFVIVIPDSNISTKDVFVQYDKKDRECLFCIDNLIDYLENDAEIRNRQIFNSLQLPAVELNPKIQEAYLDIEALSPKLISMSGSGSAVYGAFDSVELCFWAKSKLEKKWDNVFVKETIIK